MRKKIFSKSIALITMMSLVAVTPVTAFASVTEYDGDQTGIGTIKGGGDETNEVIVNGSINDTTSSNCILMNDKGTSGGGVEPLNGKVTVTKDVNLSKGTADVASLTGIKTNSVSDGKAEVDIKGNLTVDASTTDDSKNIYAYGIVPAANSTVNIGKDLNVTSAGNGAATGIDAYSDNKTHDIDIGGNINAASPKGEAYGIVLRSVISADIDVGGSIVSNGGSNSYGIFAWTEADVNVTNNITVSVKEDIKATGKNGYGIRVNDNDVILDIDTEGSISGTNRGITIDNNYNKIDISADSSISGSNTGISGSDTKIYGIYVRENEGDINISTKQDITGTTNGVFINNNHGDLNISAGNDINDILINDNEKNLTITAEGDITGAENAITIKGNSDTINIISEDTIMSTAQDGAAIYVNKPQNENASLNITAWKVKSTSGALVASNNSDYADKVQASINYIIKSSTTIDGQQSDNKIVLTGIKEVKSGDKIYQTANAGKEITINVVTVDGYKYSLSDTQGLLTKTDNGTYTLKIPEGGGVDLQAVLEKITEDKKDDSGNTDSDSNKNNDKEDTDNKENNTDNGSDSNNTDKNSGIIISSRARNSTSSHVVHTEKPAAAINSDSSLIETPGTWIIDVLGNWSFTNNGTAYNNTWVVYGGKWYYLNENGHLLTGWQTINGTQYYLSAESSAAHPIGSLYIDTLTPDGFYVGSDGYRVK